MACGARHAHAARPGDVTFYDSRDPLDCDLPLFWSGINWQLSEQFVAVTKRTLAAQDGPAILVGNSYGGVVITVAGNEGRGTGLHRSLLPRTRASRCPR